jgi:hypothetical protein
LSVYVRTHRAAALRLHDVSSHWYHLRLLPLELLLELLDDEPRDTLPREDEPLLREDRTAGALLRLGAERPTLLRLGELLRLGAERPTLLRLEAFRLGAEYELPPLLEGWLRTSPPLPDERIVLEFEDRVDGRVTVVLRVRVVRLGV